MKPIGTVIVAILLLGACSHAGFLGVEIEITPDAVNFIPMDSEAGGGRSHCSPADTKKFGC
jgi:hypothetical protein